MLKDYISNAAILIAFIGICSQIFINSEFGPSLPLKSKISLGGIFGLLGIILMVFSIHLTNNLVIDFRNVSIMLSAFSGGWISAIVSSLLISIFRISLYGINRSSVAALIVILILTIIFCIIAQLKIKRQLKWLLSVTISTITSCTAFFSLIDDTSLKNKIVLSYCVGLTILSFLLYYYIRYMELLAESYRWYKQESNRDFLTGLNNLRQFDKLYKMIIDNTEINHKILSFLYIDVDFFKNINDTYGHKNGDIVLQKLSETFKKTCRSIDIISRNGGEEFSIILIDCPPTRAMKIAERIRKNVENTPIELSNRTKINITISIGVASYPDPINNLSILKEAADNALYEAKKTGRNKIVFFR